MQELWQANKVPYRGICHSNDPIKFSTRNQSQQDWWTQMAEWMVVYMTAIFKNLATCINQLEIMAGYNITQPL